jgi:pilus assembly protein TadC
MARFGLMNKTEFPEAKRPLTPEEVDYLSGELKVFNRWRTFYTVMAFPFTPLGVLAGVAAILMLVVGDQYIHNPMQAFIVGMVISIAGFTPLYLRFAMKDRAAEVREILDTYPRATASGSDASESGDGIDDSSSPEGPSD